MLVGEDVLRLLDFDAWCRRTATAARTDCGRDAAMAARPALTLGDALELLAETREALELLRSGRLPGFQVGRDGLELLEHARGEGRPLLVRELAVLCRFLREAHVLRGALLALSSHPALAAIGRGMIDLGRLVSVLEEALDERGQLLDSASPRLGEVRRELGLLRETVRRDLERFASRKEVRPLLRSNHPSLRDGRLVLAVRLGARGQIPGLYHDRSQSGATVYVEPEQIIAAQNRVRDLHIDEQREVVRILWQITRELFSHAGDLAAVRRQVARFDLAAARARVAQECGLEEPRLVEDGILELAGARHPLLLGLRIDGAQGSPEERLERARLEVAPFDLRLGDTLDMMVLTGPNTGGKTVTLKALGLLAILPRAGHFLPTASGARVPWFDGVFADVGDEQDLTQNLSTFSGHVRRIAAILADAQPGALVLLDELGSGTDPLEGEALAIALLEDLLKRKLRVVVTTHLGRLKQFAGRKERVTNASMEFDPVSLQPTFRLILGLPGASNALKISARLGLPAGVLERARELLGPTGHRSTTLFDQLDRTRAALEELRRTAAEDRREAAMVRARSEQEAERLKRSRAALMQQAEEAAEARLRQLGLQLEAPRRVLLALGGKAAAAAGMLLEALRKVQAAGPLEERRRRFVGTLKTGDKVFLPEYNEICAVRRILKKEQRIEVTYRAMLLTVPFHQVAPAAQSHLYRPEETS